MIKRIATPGTPLPRLSLNVGAGLDLPTGYFIKGKYGEDILIGGMSNLQGEMGDPNTDKSTIALYMLLSGLNTVAYSYISELLIYCSEGTLREERINKLAEAFEYLDRDENGELIIAFNNIKEMSPEEWYDKVLATYVKTKRESTEYMVEYEFLKDPDKKDKPLKMKLPTGLLIDTITYFDPSNSIDMIMGEVKNTKTDAAGKSTDSSNRTIGLNNAKFKTDIMSTMTPGMLRTNTYAMITAHVGDNVNMENSPYGPKPRQQIGTLSSNEKIKGVPSNYTRLLTSLWQTTSKRPLVNQGTMLAEYPKNDGTDKIREELHIIGLKQHRSKDNLSNIRMEIITSQREGVRPHLSQFHFLKNNKFGFEGNLITYNLILYPSVKITRPTIRTLIDTDPKMRRALEFTSDYLQMTMYFSEYEAMGLYCGLDVLYKDIDAMGYDWDKILTLTRNFWTPMHYSKIGYLHILNLLKIRKGLPFEYKEMLNLIRKDK